MGPAYGLGDSPLAKVEQPAATLNAEQPTWLPADVMRPWALTHAVVDWVQEPSAAAAALAPVARNWNDVTVPAVG